MPPRDAQVPLTTLKGALPGEAGGRWFELTNREGRPAGQAHLALRLEQVRGLGAAAGGTLLSGGGGGGTVPPSPSTVTASAADEGGAAAEAPGETDHFRLSGQWRGLFWQPEVPKGGDSVQAGEMELVFAAADDADDAEWQRVSGTGQDALGAYELRAGRRYLASGHVEWVKQYTAMSRAYAQLDPAKLEKAEKDKATAVAAGDTSAQEARAAPRAQAHCARARVLLSRRCPSCPSPANVAPVSR